MLKKNSEAVGQCEWDSGSVLTLCPGRTPGGRRSSWFWTWGSPTWCWWTGMKESENSNWSECDEQNSKRSSFSQISFTKTKSAVIITVRVLYRFCSSHPQRLSGQRVKIMDHISGWEGGGGGRGEWSNYSEGSVCTARQHSQPERQRSGERWNAAFCKPLFSSPTRVPARKSRETKSPLALQTTTDRGNNIYFKEPSWNRNRFTWKMSYLLPMMSRGRGKGLIISLSWWRNNSQQHQRQNTVTRLMSAPIFVYVGLRPDISSVNNKVIKIIIYN